MGQIEHISDYIAEIEKQIGNAGEEQTIVFRGEIQEFEKPCYPNLFRKQILENNPYFEKNQFDEMTANHLTRGETYLEKAIDAQHGGFPSRLLDVTYNCLIALYFAVTPFYYEAEESTDAKDGMVYIFPVEKMYCPTGNNINNAYNAIVQRKEEWLNKEPIFQKNHKLIDHIKLNTRIVAQQGAFILFQGDEGEEIPDYQYKKLRIKGENKKVLRGELKHLCGIHTGSVYPEKYNLVNEIVRKTSYVNAKEFSIQSELEMVIFNLQRCMEHYVEELEHARQREIYIELIRIFERRIGEYKNGILSLERGKETYGNPPGYEEALREAKEKYNVCVEDFFRELEEFIPAEIETSREFLLLS